MAKPPTTRGVAGSTMPEGAAFPGVASGEPGRFPCMDGLRACAALGVLAFHFSRASLATDPDWL
ncbi:MAG: hypothetical protein FJW88_13355 [Actinobacteria bacterium]|nr:hypothetical protein [Actinomycetota bacterium]